MTFEPANAGRFIATVRENLQLSSRYFLLHISRPSDMPAPAAGQFVHVGVPASGRFFLRRPFSIFDCDLSSIALLIAELGPGTRALRRLQRGESIDFYGPLGNAFPVMPGKRILAIGGGVGLAPLYFYAFRTLDGCGPYYRVVYGARTQEDLFLDNIPLEDESVLLATEDGSYGYHGNAVECAAEEFGRDPADVLFSCGPAPMLRAATKLAEERGIPHYVSLENRMGCALGACRACVVPTRLGDGSPYRTVCHDGPVFDASVIVWDELPQP